jgi:hypothetical protein
VRVRFYLPLASRSDTSFEAEVCLAASQHSCHTIISFYEQFNPAHEVLAELATETIDDEFIMKSDEELAGENKRE